jgi:hypothetical protein
MRLAYWPVSLQGLVDLTNSAIPSAKDRGTTVLEEQQKVYIQQTTLSCIPLAHILLMMGHITGDGRKKISPFKSTDSLMDFGS